MIWFSLVLWHINHHHYHHVTLSARIPLTLSRYPSLSSIASGRSSGLHPVSAQSCCMQVRAGRHAFARPCEGVHRSTSLMNSSLLLQKCPAYLVRLILIVFVMSSRWPYCCCFVGCCLQDLFNIARSISVSSTETDIDTRLTKASTAIDRLSVIWKSDLTDKMKRFLPSSGSISNNSI